MKRFSLSVLLCIASLALPRLVSAQVATFVKSLGSSGALNGPLKGPVGVSYLPDTDRFAVLDYGNNRVEIFNGNGSFDSAIPGLSSPIGLTASSGFYYVADSGKNRLEAYYTFDNTLILTEGSEGTGLGQYNLPRGIVRSEFNQILYTVDSGNNRVQTLQFSGQVRAQFGIFGSAPGAFNSPFGIDANPATGQIYVADRGNNRVQRFSAGGAFETLWGAAGTTDGLFSGPQGVEVDASGKVYVSDGSGRIQRFTADGAFEFSFVAKSPVNGATALPYGMDSYFTNGVPFLAVSDLVNNLVEVYQITEKDSAGPRLTVKGKPRVVTKAAVYAFSGKAFDTTDRPAEAVAGIAFVEVKVGTAPYKRAAATIAAGQLSWTFKARVPKKGRYRVLFRATDNAGNLSPETAVILVRS